MGVFFGEVTLETVKGRASYHDISDEIRENINTGVVGAAFQIPFRWGLSGENR